MWELKNYSFKCGYCRITLNITMFLKKRKKERESKHIQNTNYASLIINLSIRIQKLQKYVIIHTHTNVMQTCQMWGLKNYSFMCGYCRITLNITMFLKKRKKEREFKRIQNTNYASLIINLSIRIQKLSKPVIIHTHTNVMQNCHIGYNQKKKKQGTEHFLTINILFDK